MNRDMELIRKILTTIATGPWSCPEKVLIEGYSHEQVGFHLWLLHNAGFIKGMPQQNHGEGVSLDRVECLTWAGYEYLDKLRQVKLLPPIPPPP